MFTKLKNKIAEEVKQSPLKLSASVQQLAQAVVSPSSSSIVEPASNDHFSIGEDSEETPQNSPSKSGGFQSVELHGDVPVSPPVQAGGRSRRSSTCSVSSDTSSLFPIFESSITSPFSLQSDLESASEVEDSLHQLEGISKEQLYAAYRKVQTRYAKYKGRYSDLARHYRELDRENVKAKTVLVESQDKALRRIAELKEQCQLEQKAKAHLEDVLRNDLEEKDHLINTLYTKLELLKSSGGKEADDSSSQKESSSENLLIDLSGEANAAAQPNSTLNESISTETAEAYEEKLKKLNSLLSKCKESIKRNKDRISQLATENQQLQRELEETKTSSSSQLSTLTEDLTGAREEIVKLVEALETLKKREEDAALSLAENKLTIHRELESKEEQIKSLRDSLTQLTQDKEALVDRATVLQNEVTELKSAASLPAEDLNGSEEDRKNLIQELSRGKAEAVRLLQQEMQKKLIDLEMKMTDKLQESENRNSQLSAEIETLKLQIEEKDQAYKVLQQEELKVRKENVQLETQGSSSEENAKCGEKVKDLEKQLDVAQKKLYEKETAIADMETNSKHATDEYIKQLFALEAKVKAETADRLLAEGKLSDKDNEIDELNNKHEEQLKTLSEIKSVLDDELLKKSETEKKNKELLNQMGNLETSIGNKDTEIASWKERSHDLEMKLKESEDGYGKIRKEKENLSLILASSCKSVTQLKNSFQILRTDLTSAMHNIRDDICTVQNQLVSAFEKSQKELVNVKQELENKIDIEDKLKKTVVTLEKELNEQKESIKFAGDLEGLLEELRAAKRRLESELSENGALVKKLHNELENTTKTLETKDEELSRLHNSANGLQQELTQTSQKMTNDLMNLKNEFSAKLEAKKAEYLDVQNKLQESENRIHSIENNTKRVLNESNKVLETVKSENEKLNNRVKELEAESEALKAEAAEEYDSLNKKLQEFAESNKETKELIMKMEKLSKELSNCNEEKEALSKQVQEISEKASSLSKDIKLQEEAWMKEKKTDKTKVKKLEQAVNSLEEQLKTEKEKYETEISNLSSQLELSKQKEQEFCSSSESLKETLKMKNEGSQKSISNLKKQLDKSHELAEELSARVETIRKENTSSQELLEKRKLEIQNLEAEKESILATFDSQKSIIQDLESKLGILTEEKEKWSKERIVLENNEKELSQLKVDLEDKLSLETETRSLLEEEYQSLNKNADELKNQVEQLMLQVTNLQETNQTRSSEIEVLHSEREAMQQFLNNAAINENQYRARIEEVTRNLKTENSNLNLAVTAKSQQLVDLKKELKTLLSERNALQELQQNFEELRMENNSLDQQLNRILKENKSLEQQLKSEVDYQEQGRTALEKIHSENEELKKQAESISEKSLALEQRLKETTELLEVAQSKLKTEQENNDTTDLRKQLEEILKEKINVEEKLKAEIESSKELEETTTSELERLQVEKEQLEQQLDNTLLDLQAKEKQVADLEDIHAQKIKQFVHNYEQQLAQKNEELDNMENKKFERQEQEDNLQLKEYRERVRELQETAESQAEAYQQLYLQHKDCKQEKEVEQRDFEQQRRELQAAHQNELSKADERWRKYLEQQLTEAEAKHKQELMELSKEWHWERKNHVLNTEEPVPKELESTSQLAVAAVESGTGSIELLHRQLVAQTNELKEAKRKHRLEVSELQRLLSLRRSSNPGDRGLGNPTLEDACTELEYLRNILYEYMMGKEPVVLARVIAAVVKFDTDQTTRVLQKEEQKQTLKNVHGIFK